MRAHERGGRRLCAPTTSAAVTTYIVPQRVRQDAPPHQPLAGHVQPQGCSTTKSEYSLPRRTIKWVREILPTVELRRERERRASADDCGALRPNRNVGRRSTAPVHPYTAPRNTVVNLFPRGHRRRPLPPAPHVAVEPPRPRDSSACGSTKRGQHDASAVSVQATG